MFVCISSYSWARLVVAVLLLFVSGYLPEYWLASVSFANTELSVEDT